MDALELSCNSSEIFELLQQRGFTFSPDAAKKAVMRGHHEALAYHVKNGADLLAIKEGNQNAMDLAVCAWDTDVPLIQYLESEGFELTTQHLNIVEALFFKLEKEKGAKISGPSCNLRPHTDKVLAYIASRLNQSPESTPVN